VRALSKPGFEAAGFRIEPFSPGESGEFETKSRGFGADMISMARVCIQVF